MRTAAISALLAALAAGGCRHKDSDYQPKAPESTVVLKGKVTYQGKSVPAGIIRVMAEDSRAEVMTRIQKNATYSVAGPAGKVRVTVDTSVIRDEYDDPAERKKWYVPIPTRYGTYSETPLRIEVGGDQTLDIDLTDP